MKPSKSVFVCQECGAQAPKWAGRCSDCGAWNSLVEERVADTAVAGNHRYASLGAAGSAKLYSDVENAHAARLSAQSDVSPRTDVRSTADYRRAAFARVVTTLLASLAP